MSVVTPGRLARVTGCCVLLLVLAVAFGLTTGSSDLSLGRVLELATGGEVAAHERDILWRIRLPRVLLALVVGAALATSGVVFQALLRNPLADPFILGVSGGAALGAVAMLSFGSLLGLGYGAVAPAAFAGCLLVTLLLSLMAGGRRIVPTQLLLTGVVFNAFSSAAIVFLASLSGLVEGGRIYLWLIGNLSVARFEVSLWVTVFLALGLAAALAFARPLNLLALGDEAAAQLGVPVEAMKRALLLATSLMVGAAVSVSGLVGFVGLIVPHWLRLIVGPDHRVLVPAAALTGAAFLVVCDSLARSLLGARELPVGAVTAIAGGPLFLFLLLRHHRRGDA